MIAPPDLCLGTIERPLRTSMGAMMHCREMMTKNMMEKMKAKRKLRIWCHCDDCATRSVWGPLRDHWELLWEQWVLCLCVDALQENAGLCWDFKVQKFICKITLGHWSSIHNWCANTWLVWRQRIQTNTKHKIPTLNMYFIFIFSMWRSGVFEWMQK